MCLFFFLNNNSLMKKWMIFSWNKDKWFNSLEKVLSSLLSKSLPWFHMFSSLVVRYLSLILNCPVLHLYQNTLKKTEANSSLFIVIDGREGSHEYWIPSVHSGTKTSLNSMGAGKCRSHLQATLGFDELPFISPHWNRTYLRSISFIDKF